MWKKEYIRYLKSKSTWVLLLLVLIGSISFGISLGDKSMFLAQLGSSSPDLNVTALKEMLTNYTGFRFLFDFWFVSDFFLVFLVVLLIWTGIFLAAVPQQQKVDGIGNMVVIRCSYRTYIKSMLAAQSFYILTVTCLSTLLLGLAAMISGGFHFEYFELGAYRMGLWGTLLTVTLHTLWIALFLILVNGICLLSNAWIKNKYVIQSLALVGFSLAPMLLGSTLGNMIPVFGQILLFFIPWEELKAVEFLFQEHFSGAAWITCMVPMISYLILFVCLYLLNCKKHTENYL